MAHDLDQLSRYCTDNSTDHGFWDNYNPYNAKDVIVKLALIHSEVSEALEEARLWDIDDNTDNQSKFDEELIDILIRTLDLLGARKTLVQALFDKKMAKNKVRPYMHGKNA